MKVKRYKRVSKYLQFYRTNFGFRAPYQVLIDGTFCQRALKNKVNIREQLPKYIGDEVTFNTTICVINEVQNIGHSVYGAFLIVKQFKPRKCGHKNPIGAAACIRSLVGKENSDHFIVATSDKVLTQELRKVPGCPLLYLKNNNMNLEAPSQASIENGTEIKRKQVGSEQVELERLRELKGELLGANEEDEASKKKKRKGPKQPNPLSCKKKKKIANNQANKTNSKSTEDSKTERKRRRRKQSTNFSIIQKVIDTFTKPNNEENPDN
ncbi:rRNA-processing protein UTP23 homolog [Panonychus citri]|uniref:rRNA-processing protein UTP23 homolog n=1 Tax=Panonychus citri TaxID=50023 RepID=UPI0023077BA0|nr:rRNA-processing protein UTP23 homolog [Panonychus citri]